MDNLNNVDDLMLDRELADDELQHYGVLGMKWGVRRGKVDKAYSKASRKLEKMSDKVDRLTEKSTKLSSKADRARYGFLGSNEKARKKEYKAAKKAYKADKKMKKAVKWIDQMKTTFADTDVKLSKEQVALGKRYVEDIANRRDIRVNTIRGARPS